jgi:N-methylhydantoinase B
MSGTLRLEVFHHLFAACAEEMGASLQRSAFSANIKERRDFSCALFDGAARMISQAAHIPIHLGSVPLCVAAVLEDLELEPGDAVLLNDPFRGGTHLPDMTLVSPVFLPGRKRADFLVANRAHHADVGGAVPGSMAPASDVHGEGLRVPPVKLVVRDRVQRDVLALCLANMRVPRERHGDLMAQWAANRLGIQRLTELARDHGRGELLRRAAELAEWTRRLVAQEIARLPRGVQRFEDVLELGAAAGRPGGVARLRVSLQRRGAKLVVDFRECDDQVPGGLSTTRAVALSAVFYVLRLLLPAGTPTNDGVLRDVEVLTRPGSLVDAVYPTPVAAGNVETSQRLVDVLLGALAKALAERIPAASSGTMSNLSFGGLQRGEPFSYYETIAGGAGGGPQVAGAHAVHTHMTNTRNTPIEALESELPVRVLRYGVRRGSGGAGARPGGDGVERRLLFLAPARVTWVGTRAQHGPWGLAGGEPGARGSARVLRSSSRREEALPDSGVVDLVAGEGLSVLTPGGGGHGRARRSARRRRQA